MTHEETSILQAKEKYGLQKDIYINATCWSELSKLPLPEELMREYIDELNWENISMYQDLSENFMREFANKICWEYASCYQKMSYDFIREMDALGKINWKYLSHLRNMDEDFIREFKDKLNLFVVVYLNQPENISEEYKDELKKEIKKQKTM